MEELRQILEHLQQPEYIHVLLNPLPVYGMAAGVLILLYSTLTHHPKEQTGSLLWLVLMGIMTFVVIHYGQEGYGRVNGMSKPDAQLWLKVHMWRAEKFMWVFYATGLAALAVILTKRKWPKLSQGLVWATLVLAFVSMQLGGWISHAGGQVRHSEFRSGPPPSSAMPGEEMSEHHQ